ncbi:MarP family serine protease [Nakamurella aerolata]|uniref:MarP family serine protease n=1 Tax=Nakamurella aerolata TaxID=1656892 RepID=A0A849A6X8_9ACTN|nr:MarP family serine protease [Nakamurella aerolata]
MTFIDAIIVVLLIWAAVTGLRQGLVTAGLALIGAVGGAILALRLAPLVMDRLADSGARVALGVACVIVGVGLGELLGSWIGRKISSTITWTPAVAVDRGLGLIGHTLAVVLITWLVAIPLASAPMPWLSSAVRGSAVLEKIDDAMPEGAQNISSALGRALNASGFPSILSPLDRTPTQDVPAPDTGVAADPQVQTASDSIVKVLASAQQCNRGMEGTGWVIAPEQVMTNAHVVAGANTTSVSIDGQQYRASVVRYEPDIDVAVLRVPGLTAPALTFDPAPRESGTSAVVAGYPLNGPYTVVPARVSTMFELRGPNIYQDSTVQREVYTLRAVVKPGNSGGPLLASDGTVIGLIFGTAPDVSGVGYALTGAEIQREYTAGLTDTSRADTGACLPDAA